MSSQKNIIKRGGIGATSEASVAVRLGMDNEGSIPSPALLPPEVEKLCENAVGLLIPEMDVDYIVASGLSYNKMNKREQKIKQLKDFARKVWEMKK